MTLEGDRASVPGLPVALARELASLNPEQRSAVEHSGSPLLILAGAGSGKTRVISTKIAHLVESGAMEPRSILAVTFTNKAAEEMRLRTLALSPRTAEVVFRTFHSFGAWLLRRNSRLAGLEPRFRICDEDDTVSLLQRIVDDLPAEAPAAVRRAWAAPELRSIAERISRAKDWGAGPQEISDSEAVRWLYARYELRLRESGSVDFGDLILLPVRLLRANPELRERLRQRFRAILVDEYQDSNRAQFELLRELHGEGCYLCVVGDDDQSIYKFRGAVVENILTFPQAFAGTEIVRLERNYRSSQSILDLASAVVSRNRGRLGKVLVADRAGGEPPAYKLLQDQQAEAGFVAELVRTNPALSTAVLYRMNHQSRAFETELARQGIGYRVVGTVRFFERAEIKDAVSYLSLLINPKDEIAYARVANTPSRGVGKRSLEKVLELRAECGGDLLLASRRSLERLAKSARSGLEGFLAVIDETRSLLPAMALDRLVDHLLRSSGLLEYYGAMDSGSGAPDSAARLDNLKELVSMAAGRPGGEDGLCALLEEAALDSGGEKGEDRGVTLITMHATKGLEFDRVVITGIEDGIFPMVREGVTDVEEERRLFYVGITRARHLLYLTSCRRRRMYGREVELSPSRFLTELPRELLGQGEGASGAEDDGFPLGCAVFHERYGRGVVEDKWAGDETAVLVRFDTGKSVRFVLRFSGLEKVAHDDP